MRRSLLSLFFLLGVHFLQAQNDTVGTDPDKSDLESTGLPKQIDSLLAENIHFHFTRSSDGKDIRLQGPGAIFEPEARNGLYWTAVDSSEELTMQVRGWRHLNGALSFQVTVKALQDLELKEIAMHIPLRPDSIFTWRKDTSQKDTILVVITTRYMLPGHIRLGYVLLGKEWANEGKGGITVGIKGRSLLANNYSGAHSMKKGDRLEYDFNLVVLRHQNHKITGNEIIQDKKGHRIADAGELLPDRSALGRTDQPGRVVCLSASGHCGR